jgi:hypothetical protein
METAAEKCTSTSQCGLCRLSRGTEEVIALLLLLLLLLLMLLPLLLLLYAAQCCADIDMW